MKQETYRREFMQFGAAVGPAQPPIARNRVPRGAALDGPEGVSRVPQAGLALPFEVR